MSLPEQTNSSRPDVAHTPDPTCWSSQGLAGNSFVAKHLEVERLYPLKQHSFEEILAHHWAKLMITVVLLSLVLCLVTLASCILRRTLPQVLGSKLHTPVLLARAALPLVLVPRYLAAVLLDAI